MSLAILPNFQATLSKEVLWNGGRERGQGRKTPSFIRKRESSTINLMDKCK